MATENVTPTQSPAKLNTGFAISALAELSYITKHLRGITSAQDAVDEEIAFVVRALLARIDDINDVVSEFFDPQDGLTNSQIFQVLERRAPNKEDLKWCPELVAEGQIPS